jgi:hypothetical protein
MNTAEQNQGQPLPDALRVEAQADEQLVGLMAQDEEAVVLEIVEVPEGVNRSVSLKDQFGWWVATWIFVSKYAIHDLCI